MRGDREMRLLIRGGWRSGGGETVAAAAGGRGGYRPRRCARGTGEDVGGAVWNRLAGVSG